MLVHSRYLPGLLSMYFFRISRCESAAPRRNSIQLIPESGRSLSARAHGVAPRRTPEVTSMMFFHTRYHGTRAKDKVTRAGHSLRSALVTAPEISNRLMNHSVMRDRQTFSGKIVIEQTVKATPTRTRERKAVKEGTARSRAAATFRRLTGGRSNGTKNERNTCHLPTSHRRRCPLAALGCVGVSEKTRASG